MPVTPSIVTRQWSATVGSVRLDCMVEGAGHLSPAFSSTAPLFCVQFTESELHWLTTSHRAERNEHSYAGPEPYASSESIEIGSP